MPANFDNGLQRRIVVAQYAYWAGDYTYALQQYEEIARLTDDKGGDLQESGRLPALSTESAASFDDLLRFVAQDRANGLARKLREAENLALRNEYFPYRTKPLILESKSGLLRGALRQLTHRTFEMRAYLTDFADSERVLKLARDRNAQSQGDLTSVPQKANELNYVRYYRWSQDQQGLFIDVQVDDFVFVIATATWSESFLSRNELQIINQFQRVLDYLDAD